MSGIGPIVFDPKDWMHCVHMGWRVRIGPDLLPVKPCEQCEESSERDTRPEGIRANGSKRYE